MQALSVNLLQVLLKRLLPPRTHGLEDTCVVALPGVVSGNERCGAAGGLYISLPVKCARALWHDTAGIAQRTREQSREGYAIDSTMKGKSDAVIFRGDSPMDTS